MFQGILATKFLMTFNHIFHIEQIIALWYLTTAIWCSSEQYHSCQYSGMRIYKSGNAFIRLAISSFNMHFPLICRFFDIAQGLLIFGNRFSKFYLMSSFFILVKLGEFDNFRLSQSEQPNFDYPHMHIII